MATAQIITGMNGEIIILQQTETTCYRLRPQAISGIKPCELLTYEGVMLERQLCGYDVTAPTVFSTHFIRGSDIIASSIRCCVNRYSHGVTSAKGFYRNNECWVIYLKCVLLLLFL